jgi:hypothetical protein
LKQVGRELGVRYVLEGSVRKASGRVRITAQLIEAQTGSHLWADRFDGSLEDVFELQDAVAISVAGVIEPTLQAAEIRRSAEIPTNDTAAYDLYLHALAFAFSWEREAILRALDLLGRTIERDPRYGLALILAARCHGDLHVNGWTDDPETSRRDGIELARRALGVASGEPEVLAVAANVLTYFSEDIYAGIQLVDRALELNPSFARGWQQSGWLRLWVGEPDTAIKHFETSLRLSPREHRSNPFMGIGVGHFLPEDLKKREECCSYRCKRSQTGCRPTASLPLATHTWAASTTPGKPSGGYGRSQTNWCRAPRIGVTPSTESFTCRACAWRLARRSEPDLTARRIPGRHQPHLSEQADDVGGRSGAGDHRQARHRSEDRARRGYLCRRGLSGTVCSGRNGFITDKSAPFRGRPIKMVIGSPLA